MEFPAEFIEMLQKLTGDESESVISALKEEPTVAVRFNSRKPGVRFEGMEPVKWCENAFYLPNRPEFIFDPLLHAGTYYVQDASSTIYETIVKKISNEFGNLPLNVLDLCAAPGGKTTAMINVLPEGSFVTANEYEPKRVPPLKENLAKWGYPAVKVTNLDSSCFADGKTLFDIVAADAPCSGEGMMRKEKEAINQWRSSLVKSCARLQKEILQNAMKAVKPGGFLIYSTCTFNREENEENADFVAENKDFEPYDLDFPDEWGIMKGIETQLPVMRFMPHKTKGEGLFVAVFRRKGEWHNDNISAITNASASPRDNKENKKGRKSAKQIVTIDEFSETTKVLSTRPADIPYPVVNLSADEAVAYLRGEALKLPEKTPKGIVTVAFDNFNLGVVKNIGSRANNLYPKPWRIKKQK